MKLGKLKALGHNLADSFASGIGLLVGYYQMDVFAEASASTEGYIRVNFLEAKSSGAPISPSLARAIEFYRNELPGFCAKHELNLDDIKTLEARFGTDAAYGRHFSVTVQSYDGRLSTDQYVGVPGKRPRHVRR